MGEPDLVETWRLFYHEKHFLRKLMPAQTLDSRSEGPRIFTESKWGSEGQHCKSEE
jgi:hypothetical protein